jgi:hypothetical protein
LFIPDIIIALLVTVLVEGLLAFLFIRKTKYGVLFVIVMNCVTNPVMNLFIGRILVVDYVIGLLGVEIIVIIVEGFILACFLKDWKKAFLLSFILNASSLLIGLLLMPILY